MIKKTQKVKKIINGVISYGKHYFNKDVKKIELDLIVNEYAFGFGSKGWNYFSSIIQEYEDGKGENIEDYTFYKFFNHPRIKKIKYLNDILFLYDESLSKPNDFKFYLGTYPWGGYDNNNIRRGGSPWGFQYDLDTGSDTSGKFENKKNIWYQPGGIDEIQHEWEKTINLYKKIQKNGYLPFLYGDFPMVYFLIKDSGEKRAIKINGQHRLAILSATKDNPLVEVIVPNDSVQYVYEKEVNHWYYVKNNLCSKEQAIRIFNSYFINNGLEKKEKLKI